MSEVKDTLHINPGGGGSKSHAMPSERSNVHSSIRVMYHAHL